MIQDIAPHRLDNAYAPKAPRPEDALLFFSAEGRLYVSLEDGEIRFPNVGTMAAGAVYLFCWTGRGTISRRKAPGARMPHLCPD